MMRIVMSHPGLRSAAACLSVGGLIVALSLAPATASTPAPGLIGSAIVSQGAFGTIKGRLVWGAATAPEPKKLDNKAKDPEVCGKVDRVLHATPTRDVRLLSTLFPH